jgi:hypothetical protein
VSPSFSTKLQTGISRFDRNDFEATHRQSLEDISVPHQSGASQSKKTHDEKTKVSNTASCAKQGYGAALFESLHRLFQGPKGGGTGASQRSGSLKRHDIGNDGLEASSAKSSDTTPNQWLLTDCLLSTRIYSQNAPGRDPKLLLRVSRALQAFVHSTDLREIPSRDSSCVEVQSVGCTG